VVAAETGADRDIAAAIGSLPVRAWTGRVWRCHARKYAGDDAGGSLLTTGRFHRGADRFPGLAWPALYTSLAQHVALGERCRHTSRENLARLANQRISRRHIRLQAVLDLCGPAGCAGLAFPDPTLDDLCHPSDYSTGHAVALAARAHPAGVEAFLVPSCTRFPEGNLIVFIDRLRPASSIDAEDSVDPDLYVDWDAVRTGP
jgi:RES domain-containing protein